MGVVKHKPPPHDLPSLIVDQMQQRLERQLGFGSRSWPERPWPGTAATSDPRSSGQTPWGPDRPQVLVTPAPPPKPKRRRRPWTLVRIHRRLWRRYLRLVLRWARFVGARPAHRGRR